MKKNVSEVCWGAGACLRKFYRIIQERNGPFYAVDTDETKWGKELLDGVTCIAPSELSNMDVSLVIITVESAQLQGEIRSELKRLGVTDCEDVFSWIYRHDSKDRSRQSACTPHDVSMREVTPVEAKDISFVVSGKLSYEGEYSAERCLRSVKKFFPESPLILSTWDGEDVGPLRRYCSEIILSEEPACGDLFHIPGYTEDKRENSINKQQLSVHAGMNRVKTPYAARLRSDFYFENGNCLNHYNTYRSRYRKFDPTYQLFQDRVLAYRFFAFDPYYYGYAYSFMLSDCFQIGRTEDMQFLWDGHQEPDGDMNFFLRHPETKFENPDLFCHRLNAEEFFLINAVKKKGLPVHLPRYYFDRNELAAEDFYKVLASNVIIADGGQIGLRSKFDNDPREVLLMGPETLETLYHNFFIPET